MVDADTETYTVEGPDGETTDVELATGVVDLLAQQGQRKVDVVDEILIQSFAQQAHVVAHHTEGETPADVTEIEETMAELFEEAFGQSLEDAMGHSH